MSRRPGPPRRPQDDDVGDTRVADRAGSAQKGAAVTETRRGDDSGTVSDERQPSRRSPASSSWRSVPAGPNSSEPSMSAERAPLGAAGRPLSQQVVEVRGGVEDVEGRVRAEEDPAERRERGADPGEGHAQDRLVRGGWGRRGAEKGVSDRLMDDSSPSMTAGPVPGAAEGLSAAGSALTRRASKASGGRASREGTTRSASRAA